MIKNNTRTFPFFNMPQKLHDKKSSFLVSFVSFFLFLTLMNAQFRKFWKKKLRGSKAQKF